MCAKTKKAGSGSDDHNAGVPGSEDTQAGAGASTESEVPAPPPRENDDVYPHVLHAAGTIAKCSDSELKNFCATMHFVNSEVTMQMADLWKEICRTAQKNGKNSEKAAKVDLTISVSLNQTNILLMDTKVKTSFSESHSKKSEQQEDLRQVKFSLPEGD